ncbi:MAG: phosphatase PAP2 family protein [Saprospiraceae bacterium]
MDYLLQLDESIFILINRTWQNTFFDWLLPYWRNKYFWLPAYFLFTILLFVKVGKKGIPVLLFLGLTVAGSDLTSSFLIKKSVERIRPCNEEAFKKNVFLRAPCGSGFSFTSSHAANHFAVATFLLLVFGKKMKRWRFLLLFWAISIGFAQIYVGVHYPLDVLFGFIVGGIIAFLSHSFYQYFSFSVI